MAPTNWSPIGVNSLEPHALNVVRSITNVSVIAGPGAGKTELLAQRAAYLLQTGLSQNPQRILAISFKRDAATNLAERVKRRCHPDHAERMDSMTFDAFAKSIVDRFGAALPEQWRPNRDYKIFNANERMYSEFLRSLGELPEFPGSSTELLSITAQVFERDHLLGQPLPIVTGKASSALNFAAMSFWKTALRNEHGSFLTFPMLGRLAELVLRANPLLRKAVALTYSHLFLDEFQDTTHVQYELVKTMFLGKPTIVTAVGDNKQQIMRWAMAMERPFDRFEHDFEASRIPLFNNYRSSPDLVRIQHVLAQALDAGSLAPVSKVPRLVDGDSCAVWTFTNPDIEAQRIAEFIARTIVQLGLGPRDFVILVRQRADTYAPRFAAQLSIHGITLRNEAALVGDVPLQELITEELSKLVIATLRLAHDGAAPKAWTYLVATMQRIRGQSADDDYRNRLLEAELSQVAVNLRERFGALPNALQDAQEVVGSILEFIGHTTLQAYVAQYRQGDWMDKVADAVAQHLLNSLSPDGWSASLDRYEGLSSVPLMTIHKSKGLEYHTVIFVGLDDGAWWSFTKDSAEATAGFFVAFTRAKQRVVFTYCPLRGDRTKINALYELLHRANVPEIRIA